MPSPIVGTWHANGFYGNHRSRCRSDFNQEYRKAARPQPPDIFLKRMKETPSKHIFSKHDNRHAFPGSATYFEHGLGRRRIDGSLPNTQTLIDWIPLKEELERERPLLSSYQFDFHSKGKVPQVLIHHRQLQEQLLQRIPSTTYQHTYRSYCLYEPNLRIFKEQQVAELKEPETTVPTSSEPSTLASGEPPAPAPASSEASATETRTAAEAVAPAPVSGRSVFHLPPRLTVSDCLHWHNC
ncbi:ciliary microtubule inner protein 7 isoform 2-T2 [Liasis olivaceus]